MQYGYDVPPRRDLKLSVVIPVYNERETLPRLLRAVMLALPGVTREIVLVDVEGEGVDAVFTFRGTPKADLELTEGHDPLAVVGMDRLHPDVPGFIGRVTRSLPDALESRAEIDQPPRLLIGDPEHLLDVLRELPETLLTLAERLFHP